MLHNAAEVLLLLGNLQDVVVFFVFTAGRQGLVQTELRFERIVMLAHDVEHFIDVFVSLLFLIGAMCLQLGD